jgi:hypothetical protein
MKKDISVHLFLSIAHVTVFAIKRKKRIIVGYKPSTTIKRRALERLYRSFADT